MPRKERKKRGLSIMEGKTVVTGGKSPLSPIPRSRALSRHSRSITIFSGLKWSKPLPTICKTDMGPD